MSPESVSIRPSDMVEGGAVPVNQNLTWKNPHFAIWEYKKKDGTLVIGRDGNPAATVAAVITLVSDDGTEHEQMYSAGDKERFAPSPDGKTLIALTESAALSKSSNFYLLMSSLVNAGCPENKLTGDISILDGLYAHHIGLPEPKRAGLTRTPAAEGQADRERVISVPSVVHKLPWDRKGVKGAAKGAAANTDVTVAALKLVSDALDEADGDSVSRQDLAVAVFEKLANDPNKDAIANLIYAPAFMGALLANGFAVSGEDISRA